MRIAGAVRLGVPAVVLAAIAACASSGGPPAATGTGAASQSYAAPAGTPAFCARLASLTELGRLPVSIGTLAARKDVESRTQVSVVVTQLRGVLADVRAESGHDGLAAALEQLVRALGQVGDGPLPDRVRAGVTAGLEQVDALAQPTCGFPT